MRTTASIHARTGARAPARLVAALAAAVAGLAFGASPAAADHPPALTGAKPDSVPTEVPKPVKQSVGIKAETTANGLYRIELRDDITLVTHGPDLKADTGDADLLGGGGFSPGDPERTPVCATDYYQHVLYAYLSGSTSNYGTSKPTIESTMRRSNAVLNSDSLASGGPSADFKVLCDANEMRVDSFVSTGTSFNSVVNSARAAGFDDSNADYTIFLDANSSSACGVGSYRDDESPGANNVSNFGGGYAVVYKACWTDETAMHENGHNQGAVQYNAPYSTGSGGHCWDVRDVMCYSPDGGDKHQGGTELLCSDSVHYDCGWNTYFDSAPEAGEYLETHWNIGSAVNRFIEFGGAVGGNQPPVASFTESCAGLSCDFTDASTDADGTVVAHAWDFDDGATSAATDPSHAFAAPGIYNVSLEVTDDEGATNSVTVPVTVSDGSAAIELANGQAASVQAGAEGGFDRYLIRVPRRQGMLRVVTKGEDCERIGDTCIPDLDLYVRRGYDPSKGSWDCRPYLYGINEKCTIRDPQRGVWRIGVLNYSAPLGTEYTVRAIYR